MTDESDLTRSDKFHRVDYEAEADPPITEENTEDRYGHREVDMDGKQFP
jgi:hypothetical protein